MWFKRRVDQREAEEGQVSAEAASSWFIDGD